jgi:hypothetical protein
VKTESERKIEREAFDLFDRMFAEASIEPGPVLPTHFVPLNTFLAACAKRGVAVPQNPIAFWDWSERSGFKKHVHKVVSKYHKEHGSDYTPMEKGQMRLARRMAALKLAGKEGE